MYTGSQLHVTAALEDLVPFSGLHGFYSNRHRVYVDAYLKNENKILRESNKRPSVDMIPIVHVFLLSFLRKRLVTTQPFISFTKHAAAGQEK